MKKGTYMLSFLLAFVLLLSAAVMPFAQGNRVYRNETEKSTSSEGYTGDLSKAEETVKAPDKTVDTPIKAEPVTDNIAVPEENIKTDDDKTIAADENPPVKAEPADNIFDALYEYKPGAPEEEIKDLSELTENKGMLTKDKPVNTYLFTVAERGCFTYSISHLELKNSEGFYVTLYQEYYLNGNDGEKGYRLINTIVSSLGTHERSSALGLIPGNYRLVVSRNIKIPQVEYKLKVTFTEDYSFETECNDNIYRYTEIFSDVPIRGSASNLPGKHDADYYMFRMYSDGYADISFSHQEIDGIAVLWQISILTEDGRELYSANSASTDGILYSGSIGLPAGNYYISVKNRIYTDIVYKITFSRHDDSFFEKEFNDTIETAQPLDGTMSVSGSLASRLNGIDRDFFTFEVDKSGYMSVEFWHRPLVVAPDEGDKPGWNIKIYSGDGNLIYTMVSNWDNDSISTQVTGVEPGRYYISVDGDEAYHSHETYSLYVNIGSTSSWEHEPNGSPETANPITQDVAIWGTIAENSKEYDEDYYAFTLTEPIQDIALIFSHDKLSGHKDIFSFILFNGNNERVGEETKSYSDVEDTVVRYNTLPAGKYYIKVSSGVFFDKIRYSLMYTVEGEEETQ